MTEDVTDSYIPCTSALAYHWCLHGFEGFAKARDATDFLYPKGLDFSLSKHVTCMILCVTESVACSQLIPSGQI